MQIIFNYRHLLLFSDCLTLEIGTDRIFRNVGSEESTYAAQHHTRTKALLVRLQKGEIPHPLLRTHVYELSNWILPNK